MGTGISPGYRYQARIERTKLVRGAVPVLICLVMDVESNYLKSTWNGARSVLGLVEEDACTVRSKGGVEVYRAGGASKATR